MRSNLNHTFTISILNHNHTPTHPYTLSSHDFTPPAHLVAPNHLDQHHTPVYLYFTTGILSLTTTQLCGWAARSCPCVHNWVQTQPIDDHSAVSVMIPLPFSTTSFPFDTAADAVAFLPQTSQHYAHNTAALLILQYTPSTPFIIPPVGPFITAKRHRRERWLHLHVGFPIQPMCSHFAHLL